MPKVTVEKIDKSVVFHVEGEIEIESSNDFKQLIRRNMEDSEFDEIIVDMENVEYIDSSGLGAIIAIAKDCRMKAAKLKLINVPDIVYNILKLTRLDLIIDVER